MLLLACLSWLCFDGISVCLSYLHLLLVCPVLEPACWEGLRSPQTAGWSFLRQRHYKAHAELSEQRPRTDFLLGHEQQQEHGAAQHFPMLVSTGLVGNEQGSAKPKEQHGKVSTPGHSQVWESPRRMLNPLVCFTQVPVDTWAPRRQKTRTDVSNQTGLGQQGVTEDVSY